MKKLSPIAGWLSLIAGFTALLFYIVLPDLKTLIISLVLISISNGIFFLYVEGSSIKNFFSSRSAQHGTNAVILISVLLGVMIFINLLILRHKYRFDFTEGSLFTLAPQTKKFIKEIKNDEFFLAKQIWERKFNQIPVTIDEKAKQIRFMQSRGIEPSIIHQILSGKSPELL